MRITAREGPQGLIDVNMERTYLKRQVDSQRSYEQLAQLERLELALAIALEETYVELSDEIFMHLALSRQQDRKHLKDVSDTLAPRDLVNDVPTTYEDRILCYLEDVDAGRMPAQETYHTWCNDCWADVNSKAFKKLTTSDEEAPGTLAVRRFLRKHSGHDLDVEVKSEELADLETRPQTVLLASALYRRHWVALLPDRELLEYAGIGPKVLNQIRERIPYTGPQLAHHAETLLCPLCRGSGVTKSSEPGN